MLPGGFRHADHAPERSAPPASPSRPPPPRPPTSSSRPCDWDGRLAAERMRPDGHHARPQQWSLYDACCPRATRGSRQQRDVSFQQLRCDGRIGHDRGDRSAAQHAAESRGPVIRPGSTAPSASWPTSTAARCSSWISIAALGSRGDSVVLRSQPTPQTSRPPGSLPAWSQPRDHQSRGRPSTTVRRRWARRLCQQRQRSCPGMGEVAEPSADPREEQRALDQGQGGRGSRGG